jgi:hypothetical protein
VGTRERQEVGFGGAVCGREGHHALSARQYCPDYAAERASGVVSDCARLGIERPTIELLDLMPEWSAMLY